MSQIIIGALSGQQYGKRRNNCRRTWIADCQRFGIDAVFLLGCSKSDKLNSPVLPGFSDVKTPERWGDELLLPCPDAYPTLPQRTRWFCRWALKRDDWEWLFKCDDDTYICLPRLLAAAPVGHDYSGAEWKPAVRYGSGGAGYWLSRRAAEIVVQDLTALKGDEDVLVGQMLRQAGIPLRIDQRLVPWGTMNRRPQPKNQLITAHAVEWPVYEACQRDFGLSVLPLPSLEWAP